MKHTRLMKLICVVILCITAVLVLVYCGADIDVGNNGELGEQFMTFVINDDYKAAYDMVKETVNTGNFKDYWSTIQSVVKDAKSYELKQIGWNVNTSGGLTTYTTAYQVYFDNGVVALFRVITRDDINGIAGVYFADATEFINRTDSYVPVVNIILTVISILSIEFCVWMFIDCLRRKIKKKVLWAIINLVGISFTLTLGESARLNFMVGLILSRSSIAADPSTLSVMTKIVVPLGAIIYFFLRRKLTVKNDVPADLPEETLSIGEGETAESSAKPENSDE
ncbi:MAG: hypothetical protein E7660_07535 [Ruminococcaceae bacterium]|nr:hypothetical protein [Oscillospiraceae bacterium]